jgi:hypothetical protein
MNAKIEVKLTKNFSLVLLIPMIFVLGLAQFVLAEVVGKWKRYEVSYQNTTWSNNAFDLIFKGKFTSPTGRVLTQWGFYAGNNTWKIYYMPDEIGDWTFVTESPDNDLNGKSGSFTCVASNLPGKLKGVGKLWKLEDGKYDFPVIWETAKPNQWWYFKGMPASDPGVQDLLKFAADTVQARILSISMYALVLPASSSWFNGMANSQAAVPYVRNQEPDEFYQPFWDELNKKFDMARDLGMGFYIMMYSDDGEKPNNMGVTAQSTAEIRLFRYTIARLGCYPIILWDTGIDISEYRNNSWIDWFANWFLANDPWKHPVSSRSGGGSGGKFPQNATYYSDGATGNGGNDIPSRNDLLNAHNSYSVPYCYADHFRPFISRGNWDIHSIRRVMWRLGLSYGISGYADFNTRSGGTQSAVSEGGAYIGHAVRFMRERVFSGLENLVPHDELIKAASSGSPGSDVILSAKVGEEYVVYSKFGGTIGVDLSGASGALNLEWYNPRSGVFQGQTTINGGSVQSFTTPFSGDGVLHIYHSNTTSIENRLKKEAVEPILKVVPNPFHQVTKIAVSHQLSAVSKIRLALFDVNGELVEARSTDSQQLKGGIPWNASGLASGLYFVKAQIGNKTLQKRIILLK